MRPMDVEEVAKAVGGQKTGNVSGTVTSVTTDSRQIAPGALFIPLVGERFDGHDFLAQAEKAGAACVLSQKETTASRAIFVKDTKKAMGDLAAHYRSKFSIPVVAVTGSVGKTSTKEMIASVLSEGFSVHKTAGNFNNDIGLPLTVFGLEESHTAAVMEMGMNHFGELSYLTAIAKPTVAVITNIGVAHIENLGSREGILKAKCEIFEGLSADGVAVLNGEDDMLLTLGKDRPRTLWFGLTPDNDFYAKNIRPLGLTQTAFTLCHGEEEAAVGHHLGLSLGQIARGIGGFTQTGMRMQLMKTDFCTILNDSYNANPVSTKAALQVLAQEKGRKVAVLGDMLELGGFRFISIDSAYEKKLTGNVGDDQLDWLEKAVLPHAPKGNVLLTHHPMCPELSRSGMEMSPRLERIIRGGGFAALFNGHVHRSCVSEAAGVLHITGQSLSFDIEVRNRTCYYTTRGGYHYCTVDDNGAFFVESRITCPKGEIFLEKQF